MLFDDKDLEPGEVNPGLRMISSQLSFLQHLELYKASRLGDSSVEAIAVIPRLRHLVLHEARKVTDAGFQRMVAGMAEQSAKGCSLRYLELNRRGIDLPLVWNRPLAALELRISRFLAP